MTQPIDPVPTPAPVTTPVEGDVIDGKTTTSKTNTEKTTRVTTNTNKRKSAPSANPENFGPEIPGLQERPVKKNWVGAFIVAFVVVVLIASLIVLLVNHEELNKQKDLLQQQLAEAKNQQNVATTLPAKMPEVQVPASMPAPVVATTLPVQQITSVDLQTQNMQINPAQAQQNPQGDVVPQQDFPGFVRGTNGGPLEQQGQ